MQLELSRLTRQNNEIIFRLAVTSRRTWRNGKDESKNQKKWPEMRKLSKVRQEAVVSKIFLETEITCSLLKFRGSLPDQREALNNSRPKRSIKQTWPTAWRHFVGVWPYENEWKEVNKGQWDDPEITGTPHPKKNGIKIDKKLLVNVMYTWLIWGTKDEGIKQNLAQEKHLIVSGNTEMQRNKAKGLYVCVCGGGGFKATTTERKKHPSYSTFSTWRRRECLKNDEI